MTLIPTNTRNPIGRAIGLFLLVVVLGVFLDNAMAVAKAPQDNGVDMDVMDLVARLEAELKSESIPKRDAAQKKLVELGPKILNVMSPIDNTMSTDLQERVRAIRRELEKISARELTLPTKISLRGEHPVTEILKELKKQTGNEVRLNENIPFENVPVAVDWEKVEFWTALQQLLDKTKLTIDRYDGGGQALVLVSLPPVETDADSDVAVERFVPIMASTGVLALQVTRVDSSINFLSPKVSYTGIEMTMQWEPRLRPIAFDLPHKEISFMDDQGVSVTMSKNEEVTSVMVQPELSGAEFSVNLPLINRSVKEIKNLDGVIHMLVPGRFEKFEFKNVDKIPEGTWFEKADARVTFGGISKNEDVFMVKISLAFPQENNAMESYQGWVFQNRVQLKPEQGEAIDFIHCETFQQSETEVGVAYYFVEIPPNGTLTYETPAAIIKFDLPFSIKRIPLP